MRRIAIVYCLVLALLGLAFAGFFVFFKLRGPRGEPPAPSAKARSAENFWRWFSANEVAFANAVRAQGATAAVDIVEKTSARLGRVCGPAVVGEVALPDSPADRPALVVSANGSVAQFPCVEALVKEAPPLREWKVVAFRQRRPMDWSLDLAGVRLTAAQLAFRETGRHDGKVDLEVLVPGYSPSDEDRVLEALFVYLDALVGERDVEQKIGAIELVPDQGRASPPSRPLTDLPQLVDSL